MRDPPRLASNLRCLSISFQYTAYILHTAPNAIPWLPASVVSLPADLTVDSDHDARVLRSSYGDCDAPRCQYVCQRARLRDQQPKTCGESLCGA